MNFENLIEDYRSEIKTIRKDESPNLIKKLFIPTIITLLFVVGFISIFDDRHLLKFQILGITCLSIAVMLTIYYKKYIPTPNCDTSQRRILALKDLLRSKYKIDYTNSEIFELIVSYTKRRTTRLDPFSPLKESYAIFSSISILAVTVFSCLPDGTLDLQTYSNYIVIVLTLVAIICLLFPILREISEEILFRDKYIGRCLIDDLHELRLFEQVIDIK